MDIEIKKIKRTQLRILFTMSEILGYVKYEDIGKLADKLNHISNEINIEDNNYIYEKIILLETEKENMTNKIGNLEMNNESLTNRIRMLEEDFERLKKAQLDKYFKYSSEYDSTDSE